MAVATLSSVNKSQNYGIEEFTTEAIEAAVCKAIEFIISINKWPNAAESKRDDFKALFFKDDPGHYKVDFSLAITAEDIIEEEAKQYYYIIVSSEEEEEEA